MASLSSASPTLGIVATWTKSPGWPNCSSSITRTSQPSIGRLVRGLPWIAVVPPIIAFTSAYLSTASGAATENTRYGQVTARS